MCGIIGFIGNEPAAPAVFKGLLKLEYRGYDSAGLASLAGGKLHLKKDVGKIIEINKKHQLSDLPGNVAIAHTRWATHGGVNVANAHPHFDCCGRIAVVHNGIVENFREIREELRDKGHIFVSETDTEVIPHLLEELLALGVPLELAACQVNKRLCGSYAFIACSVDDPGKVIATRRDNPLVVGLGSKGIFATSDVLSLEDCDEVIYMEDGDIAVMGPESVNFLNPNGHSEERIPSPIDKNVQTNDLGNYAHYMIKEIMEEPLAIKAGIQQDEHSFTRIAIDILRARQVIITACGSSRYAALVGRYLFSEVAQKFCDVVMASEFHYFSESIDKNTLVIAVSQSGETADVIEGIKRAKANGAQVISIVNRPNSVLSRMSDHTVYLNCGPEIAVAATKSFISQLSIFYLLAFSMVNQYEKAVSDLTVVSEKLEEMFIINGVGIKDLARNLKDKADFYYIARGINFPIASEAALKLKEISYIHAEGLPAGELKHGTLALIEDGSPVAVICPEDYTAAETLGNAIEAKSRGAFLIGVSDKDDEIFDFWVKIPSVAKLYYPLVSIAPLHLLAYYIARERGNDPDKPRNLAKSVTVK